MRKFFAIILFMILTGVFASSAFACPKGQHPHGGTGPHHKGGYCSYEK